MPEKSDVAPLPRIALRPDKPGHPELDDVVVESVTTFRAEFMSTTTLWLRCYLANDTQIDFAITGKNLRMVATDVPEHEDWDKS